MCRAFESSARLSGPVGNLDRAPALNAYLGLDKGEFFLPAMFIKINQSCNIFSGEEEIMQQRFCNCGFKIWVEYLLTEWRCRTFFWPSFGRQGSHLKACPACGARLNIDNLH